MAQVVFYAIECTNVHCIYFYNGYILLMDCSLYQYKVIFAYSNFAFNSALSDMIIASPSYFWTTFPWNIFFQSFTLSVCFSLLVRYASYRHKLVGSCFQVPRVAQSQTIGLLSR
jgi:hypothetical protein